MQSSRRRHRRARGLTASLLVLATLLAGCGSSSSPSITPGTILDEGELRLLLVDRLGPRWYCDRDEYPIAVADEQIRAIERFPEMQAEGVLFNAVLRKLGMAGQATFSDADKLAIYRLWKVALSIPFDSIGNGRYRFDYTAQPAGGAAQGTRTTGTISEAGDIVVAASEPAGEPNCPICLARGTPIDTPNGSVAVEDIALGDVIWTLGAGGRHVVGHVIALGSTNAPADHRVISLTLADGRTVTASPGHPLADGRRLGELHLGDVVDGSVVVGLASLAYGGGETFDLVVSGPTGVYLSDGIPLGSTLR